MSVLSRRITWAIIAVMGWLSVFWFEVKSIGEKEAVIKQQRATQRVIRKSNSAGQKSRAVSDADVLPPGVRKLPYYR